MHERARSRGWGRCGVTSRPAYRDQLSQAEKDSTANVAQLRQHFEDIQSLDPKPRFSFICGDIVQKPAWS